MSTLIAVTGRAEERAEPELAAVRLAVAASAPDRDEALGRTAAAHDRLLADVRRLDAAGALDTWSSGELRVWSHRPWNAEGKRLPLVHDARATVEVVFRDLGAVGEWIGGVGASPEVAIEGVDWRLTDASRRRVQEHAQRAAVADAVAKAVVYASALGLGAPAPVEITDSGLLSAVPSPPPAPMRAMALMAADAGGPPSPEFAPAPLVVAASVDARFTAEPA